MKTDDLVTLGITTIITASIAFIFWALQTLISNRRNRKLDVEKEVQKRKDELRESLLGPNKIPPKDVNEAVRIAQQEGRNVRLPEARRYNAIRFFIIFIILGSITYLFSSTPAVIVETATPGNVTYEITETSNILSPTKEPTLLIVSLTRMSPTRDNSSINVTPIVTATTTLTITPTLSLSITPSPPPSVELILVNYLTQGIGCQVDIQVRVTGSPATGNFHVRNASHGEDGDVYPTSTLPPGTYWVSKYDLSNLITLGGTQPKYYQHEVWFEYNGIQSNRLTDLVCPGIPSP